MDRWDEEEQAVRGLLDRLEADHVALTAASQNSNADDEHDPEGATIACEREQLAASIERTRRRLDDVVESRALVASGRYGVCRTCGAAIAAGRLEARPHTRHCIDHA